MPLAPKRPSKPGSLTPVSAFEPCKREAKARSSLWSKRKVGLGENEKDGKYVQAARAMVKRYDVCNVAAMTRQTAWGRIWLGDRTTGSYPNDIDDSLEILSELPEACVARTIAPISHSHAILSFLF